MSRPTFRSRPIDLHRQLEVYRKADLLQRPDCKFQFSLMRFQFFVGKPGDRAMPAISSGMDAEEETEHHYQLAITTETVLLRKKLSFWPKNISSQAEGGSSRLQRPKTSTTIVTFTSHWRKKWPKSGNGVSYHRYKSFSVRAAVPERLIYSRQLHQIYRKYR